MQNKENLERSDKWIVAITAICALLLFSWLVYDIAFLNPQLEGQIAIGKIYETQNRVKRKFNSSLIWYTAEQNETVYENDWIFTGAQSIAKIKLDSGGEIIIEPDSLIILSKKNGVLQLDLQHGRLMADVKKNKEIKINIVKDGLIESVDTSAGIVSVAQEEDSVEETIIENIELDKDQDGKEDQSLSDIANQKYFKPEPGYLALEDNGLSLSEKSVFRFNILKGQKAQVALDWRDPFNRWVNYEAEIAKDADFKEVIANQSNSKTEIRFPLQASESLFWRVRGLDKNAQTSLWTKAYPLEVIITYKEKMQPLQLSRNKFLYPLKQEDLTKIKADRSYEIDDKKPIKVQWQALDGAEDYRVEVSNKPDFSNIVEQKIVKTNQVDLKNIHLGRTFFRVIPETKDGIAMAEESTGEVQTYFPAPKDESLKTIAKDNHQVLTWDAVPYAEAYQVTYKTDKNSTEEVVKFVKSNKLKVDSPTGYLEWKVRVADPKTKQSLSSNSATVDWYDKAKRLASLHGTGQAGQLYPKIVRPEPRKTFISVNNSPLFIVMNWTYEKGAPHYQVEISKKPDMKSLVYAKKVDRKRAVINQPFKPGIYFMRVRAITDDITQESWSETEVFRVINRKSQ